jgi:hypothetical protein
MTKNTTNNSSKPYTAKLGRLRITVFENVSDAGQVTFATYIRRPYLSGQGWKDGAFSEEDLDDLVKARKQALQYIANRKKEIGPSQLAA